MLPTPPMITTISAFMVKSTPDRGVEGEKDADQRARHRRQRAAERERERRHRGGIDTDQAGAGRIDGQRAHRGAEAREFENEPDCQAECAGDAEGEHPVGREREADDLHRRIEIIVEAVVRREGELRGALEHEQAVRTSPGWCRPRGRRGSGRGAPAAASGTGRSASWPRTSPAPTAPGRGADRST